jgi:type IV pilus assembly protein PilO
MASKKPKTPSIDFAALSERIQSQFRNLNPNDPSTWPALPKYAACVLVTVLVVVALWFAWLKSSDEELQAERAKEVQLRAEYSEKLAKAVNLDALNAQLRQVRLYVNQLEKQLPSKSEMDALLSDINQAGLGRSLQFEVFRPGQVNVKEYYAELPIDVRVSGRYHDIGAFTSDIANLSRIVTLNDLNITAGKDGNLQMTSIAKTFRYLDEAEVAAQRKAQTDKKGAKK